MLGSLGGALCAFRGLDMGVCGICGAAVKLDLWRLVLTAENRKNKADTLQRAQHTTQHKYIITLYAR